MDRKAPSHLINDPVWPSGLVGRLIIEQGAEMTLVVIGAGARQPETARLKQTIEACVIKSAGCNARNHLGGTIGHQDPNGATTRKNTALRVECWMEKRPQLLLLSMKDFHVIYNTD
jgi:hypothetical protein